jgi:hypothetical protein
MNKYTAHCGAEGYLYREVEGENRTMAGMYGEVPVLIDSEIVQDFMLSLEEEVNEVERTLVNSNYLGRTTNFNELSQSGVGYNIEEPNNKKNPDSDILEDVFHTDVLSWVNKEGNSVDIILNGELKGINCPKEKIATPQNLEPLTVREAAEFIDAVMKTNYAEETDRVLEASIESLLTPDLKSLLTRIENYEEAIYNHNWNLGRYITEADGTCSIPDTKKVSKWAGLKGIFNKEGLMTDIEESRFIDYMVARLKITVRDNSLGGTWPYQDEFCLGARAGVVDITKELSVQNRTKQQQYSDDNVNMLIRQAQDMDTPAPFFLQCFDRKGKSRGFGDQSIYYWRCSHSREQRFIRLQMYIMRAPIKDLKQFFTGPNSLIMNKYRDSIRSCAPGPLSKYEEGSYKDAPLTGKDATEALISRGFKAESLNENVRFHRGECWHKIWLKKEHVQKLQKMVEDRIAKSTQTLAGKIKINKDKEKAVSILQNIVTEFKATEAQT